MAGASFPAPGPADELEQGKLFTPRFDADGLMPAIVTDADTATVLMFAWMNAEALHLTLTTGITHFWSRSRAKLWRKGNESGNLLQVVDVRVDCDQDVILLRARVAGSGVACHTGAASCFYRRIARSHDFDGRFALQPVDAATGTQHPGPAATTAAKQPSGDTRESSS